MSTIASTLLRACTGYRSNAIYSGKDYLVQEVIDYECDELFNTDILSFCQTTYNWSTREDIIKGLVHHFGCTKQPIFGWWLTTLEGVKQNYIDSSTDIILKYDLPHDIIVLSDIGTDGVLFASLIPLSNMTYSTEVEHDNKKLT